MIFDDSIVDELELDEESAQIMEVVTRAIMDAYPDGVNVDALIKGLKATLAVTENIVNGERLDS